MMFIVFEVLVEFLVLNIIKGPQHAFFIKTLKRLQAGARPSFVKSNSGVHNILWNERDFQFWEANFIITSIARSL